jgi:hypothetical protein
MSDTPPSTAEPEWSELLGFDQLATLQEGGLADSHATPGREALDLAFNRISEAPPTPPI